MAGLPVNLASFSDWRRDKGRESRANELAQTRIDGSTVLFAVTGMFADVRSVHHPDLNPAVIDSVVRRSAHARSVRGGDRGNHENREYGKHSDEACEHEISIGAARQLVHCHGLRSRISVHRSSGSCSGGAVEPVQMRRTCFELALQNGRLSRRSGYCSINRPSRTF